MGNGESTSRRISMQRSDEGTIQISENVMLRLNKQKTSNSNEIALEPGEIVLREDDVKAMIEKAFHQGQNQAITKLQSEKEQLLSDQKSKEEAREAEYEKQIKMLAEYWKEQFEIETAKVRDITNEDSDAFEQMQAELTEKEKGLMSEQQFVESQKEMLSSFQQNLTTEKDSISAKYQSLVEEQENLGVEKRSLSDLKEGLGAERQSLEDFKVRLHEEKDTLSKEKAKLEEEYSLVNEEKSTLMQKQREIDGQLSQRERELSEEFERISSELDRKIKPLQKTTICSESEASVLECYRANKKHPLRCSKQVQEFVNCVQESRVKMMQKGLRKEG